MKKLSSDLQTRAKSFAGKTAVAVSAMGASVAAFAVDHSAAISAAQTDATTNTTTAVTAVIAVGAIVMGLTIVLSLIRR